MTVHKAKVSKKYRVKFRFRENKGVQVKWSPMPKKQLPREVVESYDRERDVFAGKVFEEHGAIIQFVDAGYTGSVYQRPHNGKAPPAFV